MRNSDDTKNNPMALVGPGLIFLLVSLIFFAAFNKRQFLQALLSCCTSKSTQHSDNETPLIRSGTDSEQTSIRHPTRASTPASRNANPEEYGTKARPSSAPAAARPVSSLNPTLWHRSQQTAKTKRANAFKPPF